MVLSGVELMKKTTVADENTQLFFVRLRKIPGEHWYLAEKNNYQSKTKIPRNLLTQDFNINQISFFNNHVWYHFDNGGINGWLVKNNIRRTFRRLAVKPIKQATASDLDNYSAVLEMMFDYAGHPVTPQELKQRVEQWHQQSSSFLDLSELIIAKTNSIKDLNNADFRQLNRQLLRGRPVMIRTNDLNNLKSSVVLLTGFNRRTYYYNNPWTGKLEVMSQKHLKRFWKNGDFEAISY